MTEQIEQSAPVADSTTAQPVATETPATTTADAQSGGLETAAKQEATPAPEKPKEKSDVDKAFAAMSKQIKELKRQVTAANQPRQEQQQLDPIADPDGYTKAISQQISQAQLQTRLALSEEITAEKYPDYEDMRDAFLEMAEADPALLQSMFQARNPADFAYKAAKEAKARQDIGDPVQYAEKVRLEATQKAMANIDALVEAKLKERLSGILPTSLANEQSQGGRVTNPTGYSGPTSLESILNSK